MTNGWTTSIQEQLRTDAPKTWRTVYQFTTKRYNKDRRTLDKQIAKAQDIADGKRSMAKARFVSVDGKNVGINQADIDRARDRKSTRLNSSHVAISYAVFCLKKKKNRQ